MHAIQNQFADHIRDPENNAPVDGLEDRRLGIYRDLFFNNILGFLESGFPVLKSLYADDSWSKIARGFFSTHTCRSPYFVDISKEFVEYLSNEYERVKSDPLFMMELAHYEWIELALSIRKQDNPIHVWDGKQQVEKVMLSELVELLSYSFPVHQISIDFQPKESESPTYLVVHRNQEDEVNFTEINAITAHLLNNVKSSEGIKIGKLIDNMCSEMPQVPREQIFAGAQQIVTQMLSAEILLPAD